MLCSMSIEQLPPGGTIQRYRVGTGYEIILSVSAGVRSVLTIKDADGHITYSRIYAYYEAERAQRDTDALVAMALAPRLGSRKAH